MVEKSHRNFNERSMESTQRLQTNGIKDFLLILFVSVGSSHAQQISVCAKGDNEQIPAKRSRLSIHDASYNVSFI